MRRSIFGFTLLEVMVAVAILSIALTAIFSSEGGAIRAGARARQMATATLLARCKMAEVEEQMAREGFPAVMADGEDECCEGGEQPGFSCHWQVEQVMLPDAVDTGEDPLAAATSAPGAPGGSDATGADLENALSGAAGGDVVGQFAVQYAFPIIRPMIEQQVRRATVTVRWAEGTSTPVSRGPCEEEEHNCFDVVQYLVADQGSVTPGTGVTEEDGASSPGSNPLAPQGGNNPLAPQGGNNPLAPRRN